ncbi:MAG: EamA family transporter [Cyanobacteria bacterium SBLK]|nr:EamA family transporter [Cyanobacteria bacterium SBLK]
MTWLLLAIATAFFESIKDIFSKKSLHDIDSLAVAFFLMFFTTVFLLPVLFVIPIPEIGDRFWVALLASGIINGIAWSLFMKAIQISDLSKAIPLTGLTPAFLLISSPILVGEFPNETGIFGIFLIILGTYILNLGKAAIARNFFTPFLALSRDRGSKLALCVALIWSLSGNIDKIGLQNSSPLFWITCDSALVSLLLLPFVLLRLKKIKRQLQKNWVSLMAMGLFNALTISCQMIALSLTLIVYVISIKRTSTILSVLWGSLIFREKGLQERLLGTTIMVLGVCAIAFSNT